MSDKNPTVEDIESGRPLSGLRLLVVDDSADNQLLFSRFLATSGAEIESAENGSVGVEKCLAAAELGKPFDAVIMDIRMPVMDGYEATKRLRASGFAGPVIALTAHAVPGEESRCRMAGCSEFLTKPVDRSRLTQTVLMAFRSSCDQTGQRELLEQS